MMPTAAHDGHRTNRGRLVLVVGPSGAGKDTLIASARARLAGDATVVFPRRAVTRPAATDAEDYESLTVEAFEARLRAGGFAFWWEAHGLRYGVPAGVKADLESGRTVVCNVSRRIIEMLRVRYSGCVVVLVTAPKAELVARLTERGRESQGDVAKRIGRADAGLADLAPDVTIQNVGPTDAGAELLLRVLCGA
jgi:ribose 1,5-bisphosphokinase